LILDRLALDGKDWNPQTIPNSIGAVYMFIFASLILPLLTRLQTPSTTPTKEVAITIDDLPFVSESSDFESALNNTKLLLKPFKEAHLPIACFVIGSDFEQFSSAERKRLYRCWQDVGAEFGNHTWTHADFDKVSLEHYENEILQADRSMKRDLGVSKVSYFRSPYLNDGPDHAKKNGLQWFLQAKGFREAPVTLDTEDWQFATPYDRAFIKGDKALMKRLDAAYMPYMNSMVEFFEGISQQVFDRKCALIYLLHANRLTAKKMPEVLAMLKRRGYKIVSLDRALQDPAYQSPDHYLGPGGFSWLIRWGLDKGLKLPLYPAVPKWVQSISPKD